MKAITLPKWFYILCCLTPGFLSCSAEDDTTAETEQNAPGKNLEWEVFYQAETGESITRFEISDDAQWLFYTNGLGVSYRVNKTTGEKSILGGIPLQFEKGKLYLYAIKNYKSYFSVSEDYGATQQEHLVGTYTNFAAGWYTGTFMNLIVNRMFVLPNGDLMLPHIMDRANNAAYLQDNYLIAVSKDGGTTWSRKESQNSFIAVAQGNRLFAIDEAWDGVNSSQLYYSDDLGATWQMSDLEYNPQAVDREGNLIFGFGTELRKLNGTTWKLYGWDQDKEPFVLLSGLKYGGQRGDDPNGRRMDDLEFDAQNRLYTIGKNFNTICRARLE